MNRRGLNGIDTTPSGDGNPTEGAAPRPRRIVPIVIAIVVTVAVIAAIVWGVLSWRAAAGNRTAADGTASSTQQSQQGSSGTPQSSQSSSNAPATGGSADVKELSLPFGIDGAPADAKPIEVNAGGDAAQLGDAWTFGGDYSAIGSAPIDANTVFGSSSTTPDDVYSYTASLIGRDGVKPLENAPAGTSAASTYFEPQDGTGDAKRLVWRAATIGRTATSSVDNWQLKTWDAASGKTVVLGSAQKLNNRDDTRTTGDVTTPTANSRNAYISSNVASGSGSGSGSGDSWTEKVLSYALDGSTGQGGHAVGEGAYPAATDDGVVYASGPRKGGAAGSTGNPLYGTVTSVADAPGADATPAKALSLSDASNAWGICGVQAHGSNRAVAFCNADDGGQGAWIGLWTDGFKTNKAWLHITSPTVVLSMNDNWIVWGSGSQSSDPGMFAYRLSDGKVDYLGQAAGYSRPSIAPGEDVVMVPSITGNGQAASFTVGKLV